jgi:glycosyltransferase involved in cell wall biosynthesis
MYSLKAKPSVVTVHDLMPYVFANDEYTPRPIDVLGISTRLSMSQLIHANQIICVSEYTKRDLMKYINVDPSLVRVIHHGIDHNIFKPREKTSARKILGLPLNKKIILNLGSEEPRKNIPSLIRAFHQLQKEIPDSILIRVGQKTERIRSLVSSLGLQSKIISIQNMKEISLFYNAADIFAYPSYYEGFCFPILEAMSSGCPVIAGNQTSIPEIVDEEGVLIDPFDVDSLSYWMREILLKEDLKKRLMEKSLVKSKEFTWNKCAKETLKVYNAVLHD